MGEENKTAEFLVDGLPVAGAGEFPEFAAGGIVETDELVTEYVKGMTTQPEWVIPVDWAEKAMAGINAVREFILEEQRMARMALDAFGEWLASVLRALNAAKELETAIRWAEVYNRPLAHRYHHTKKKRTRKKYAKRILTWYREEVADNDRHCPITGETIYRDLRRSAMVLRARRKNEKFPRNS